MAERSVSHIAGPNQSCGKMGSAECRQNLSVGGSQAALWDSVEQKEIEHIFTVTLLV